MNIFKSFTNKIYKLLLILTGIIVLYTFLFIVVFKKPFLLWNDQWFQYNIFYKEWIRMVLNFFKTGLLPFYSWNTYLGTDFYSAMGYYCTGDIFLPLLLLFNKNIELGLIVETILCVYISTILMYILLEKSGIYKESTKILISIIYSIGGIAVLYCGQYMFHRFFAFLPLLFIGLYNYLDKRKVTTFIIATAILMLQNYYFMFPTLIFLLIYSVSEEVKKKRVFKDILKDFFILFFCLLIGFFISAIITLPSIMYLLNNSRIGESSSNDVLWSFNTYAGLYMSLISFYPSGIINNIFQSPSNYHASYYSLFITLLPLLGLNTYIVKKENRVELITLLVLILIACLKPLSSVMHGLSIPSLRWMYLFELYLLIIGAKGLEEEISNKKITIIYGIYILGFMLFYTCLDLFNFIDFDSMKEHLVIIIVSVLISLLIFITYLKNRKLSIILTIVEVVLFEGYSLYIQSKGSYVAQDIINNEEIEYAKSNDNDTYRYSLSYKNDSPASYMNQNAGIRYNFMSIKSYNSMSDYNISTFNSISNTSDKNIEWLLQVEDPYAATMLGTKYWIVYKEDELPGELNFKYAYNLDYLKVYENLDYKGFGYTADQIIYTSEYTSSRDFVDYILVDDETIDISNYTDPSYSKLNDIFIYGNYLEANITLDEDNILLIPIPNNKGWNIKVNGGGKKPISVNGGFIGLELSSGYNEITMNFISPSFKIGLVMTTIGIFMFMVVMIIQRKRTYYGHMNNLNKERRYK